MPLIKGVAEIAGKKKERKKGTQHNRTRKSTVMKSAGESERPRMRINEVKIE